MLVELSALIGARQNKNEIAQWFEALPKLDDPDKYLAGLTRGLRLTNTRNLQVPGAEKAFTGLLVSGSEARAACRVGSVPLFRTCARSYAGRARTPLASDLPHCQAGYGSSGLARRSL